MLQLVLVRHGETEWTERGLLHGRLDSPLSAIGRRHAGQTALRLRGERFDGFYTSPQGRAMQTAEILAQAVEMAPIPLEGLREMDFGWPEGKSLRFFDPAGDGLRWFRPLVHVALALTAERASRFRGRVAAALDLILERHPHGRVLVVTHWGVLSMMMAVLKEADPTSWRRYGPWVACGISELHGEDGTWQVARLNDRAHLD